MRDFRAQLADVPCWDRVAEASFEAHGEALLDCALQNREELIGLCELIEEQRIRSYLEIGVWTGRTVSALHGIFRFDLVAACDHGWARRFGLPVTLPAETRLFEGDSESDEYLVWRAGLGPIDLVLIDANHSYHAVRRDLERNAAFPVRFLALHDITGHRRATTGVAQLWRDLVASRKGRCREIVRPHRELGLDHSTMGIGVWSSAGE